MGMRHDCLAATLRREINRTILERIQGKMMNLAIDRQTEEERPDLPYEVEESLNNPYMNRQEVALAMDIFKPKTEKGRELPVIVVIHGGGLVMGDRKISRRFSRILAGHGYLVFSVEYRLAPRANCAEQLDDVCAGMDIIGRELVNYDVDFSRIFLIAESAGAYLATYVTAMRGSEKLQEAIGYEPSKMVFKAVGLISGMFYTEKRDLIGVLLAEQFYGDKSNNKTFLKYMDPENPEILDHLPPAFLVTSRGDFLNNYTLMFHDALKKGNKRTHLLYYRDKDLHHAFVTFQPTHEKSEEAINKMLAWFEAEADFTRKKAEEKNRELKAAAEKNKTETAEEISENKPAPKRTRTATETTTKTGRGRKKESGQKENQKETQKKTQTATQKKNQIEKQKENQKENQTEIQKENRKQNQVDNQKENQEENRIENQTESQIDNQKENHKES